jgi:acid phosphatase (class A)
MGLILAELAPERATPILNRGRAYGESRVVCGVH